MGTILNKKCIEKIKKIQEYRRKYYQRNKEKIDKKNKLWWKINKNKPRYKKYSKLDRNIVRLLIYSIKESFPCADCNVFYKHHIMDFDHCRGEKKFKISNRAGLSIDELLKEVSKCEIVCSNCHRERSQIRLKRGK